MLEWDSLQLGICNSPEKLLSIHSFNLASSCCFILYYRKSIWWAAGYLPIKDSIDAQFMT